MAINSQKKILVVEDEEILRQQLVEALRREDFNVLAAEDGQIGLEVALKEHPDCILMNIEMPIMDGLTALRHLRKDSWGASCPVVILTNRNEWKKINEAVKHRAFDYLVKSDWKIADVVQRVKEKIRK